jgi:hypothetical protein
MKNAKCKMDLMRTFCIFPFAFLSFYCFDAGKSVAEIPLPALGLPAIAFSNRRGIMRRPVGWRPGSWSTAPATVYLRFMLSWFVRGESYSLTPHPSSISGGREFSFFHEPTKARQGLR